MKRTITALGALTILVATPALAQPDRHGDHRGPAHGRPGPAARPGPGRPAAGWRRGGHLPRQYWGNNGYVVNDWQQRRLRRPPRGYHWVRSGNDYVLAAVATGLIASIIAASNN